MCLIYGRPKSSQTPYRSPKAHTRAPPCPPNSSQDALSADFVWFWLFLGTWLGAQEGAQNVKAALEALQEPQEQTRQGTPKIIREATIHSLGLHRSRCHAVWGPMCVGAMLWLFSNLCSRVNEMYYKKAAVFNPSKWCKNTYVVINMFGFQQPSRSIKYEPTCVCVCVCACNNANPFVGLY